MADTTSDNRTPNVGDAPPKRATSGGASAPRRADRRAHRVGRHRPQASTSARTPAAKAANKTTAARGARTAAERQTREAAQAQSRAARPPRTRAGSPPSASTLTTSAPRSRRATASSGRQRRVEHLRHPVTGGDGASEQLRAFERRGHRAQPARARGQARAHAVRARARSRRRDAERAVTRAKEQVANLT